MPLPVRMTERVYVCSHDRMCVRVCSHVYVCSHDSLCMCVRMVLVCLCCLECAYVCASAVCGYCLPVRMIECVYVCMCVCLYVCMCVCVYVCACAVCLCVLDTRRKNAGGVAISAHEPFRA